MFVQQLQKSNISSLSLSAETAVYEFSFFCTTHVGASFSWMFVSKLQWPKHAGFRMAYNG